MYLNFFQHPNFINLYSIFPHLIVGGPVGIAVVLGVGMILGVVMTLWVV